MFNQPITIGLERTVGLLVVAARLVMKSVWLLHLIGDEAPPIAHDDNEAARAKN